MNLIQEGKYLFEEKKVRTYPTNQNCLTLVEAVTKANEEATRTRNYITRYNSLEKFARVAKMFNDSKKSLNDLLQKDEIISLMSVEVAKGTKFKEVDNNFKPLLNDNGEEIIQTSQNNQLYVVVDFDKNGFAILLPSVMCKLNKIVEKEGKKYLDSVLNYMCNAIVENTTPERLQFVYLSQLPEKQIQEEHKQHINKYMFDCLETKDSYRRAIIPILQTIVISSSMEGEGKTNPDMRRAILNKKCYNAFFNSIVVCLNKEALPKKAKKCDVKALKGYVIEQISERSLLDIQSDIERAFNQFN